MHGLAGSSVDIGHIGIHHAPWLTCPVLPTLLINLFIDYLVPYGVVARHTWVPSPLTVSLHQPVIFFVIFKLTICNFLYIKIGLTLYVLTIEHIAISPR